MLFLHCERRRASELRKSELDTNDRDSVFGEHWGESLHCMLPAILCHQSHGIKMESFFFLADINPPVEGSMAHTGLFSLGSLVLRIMAQPQAALFWLSCIHSEDSKANNEPT